MISSGIASCRSRRKFSRSRSPCARRMSRGSSMKQHKFHQVRLNPVRSSVWSGEPNRRNTNAATTPHNAPNGTSVIATHALHPVSFRKPVRPVICARTRHAELRQQRNRKILQLGSPRLPLRGRKQNRRNFPGIDAMVGNPSVVIVFQNTARSLAQRRLPRSAVTPP